MRPWLAENREAQRSGSRIPFDEVLTRQESLTVDSPSENLFDLLPLRQLVVFVVRAHHRPMTELATLLGLSRQSVATGARPTLSGADDRLDRALATC